MVQVAVWDAADRVAGDGTAVWVHMGKLVQHLCGVLYNRDWYGDYVWQQATV